jgi:hypothetical protein
MTFAELVLLVGGGAGVYFALRPLQRWLEGYLLRTFFARHPRTALPTIHLLEFKSEPSDKKEDHQK